MTDQNIRATEQRGPTAEQVRPNDNAMGVLAKAKRPTIAFAERVMSALTELEASDGEAQEEPGPILKVPQIAEVIFGANTKATRRKVYYAMSQNQLPHFRVGNQIFARKGSLLKWIADQEAASVQPKRK